MPKPDNGYDNISDEIRKAMKKKNGPRPMPTVLTDALNLKAKMKIHEEKHKQDKINTVKLFKDKKTISKESNEPTTSIKNKP